MQNANQDIELAPDNSDRDVDRNSATRNGRAYLHVTGIDKDNSSTEVHVQTILIKQLSH